MARRSDDTILDGGDMSGNLTSEVVALDHLCGYAVQFVWSGSSIGGTVHLEGSVDGETWVMIDESDEDIAGSSGEGLLNVWQTFYRYFRAVYTASTGTGSLTIKFHAKG